MTAKLPTFYFKKLAAFYFYLSMHILFNLIFIERNKGKKNNENTEKISHNHFITTHSGRDGFYFS